MAGGAERLGSARVQIVKRRSLRQLVLALIIGGIVGLGAELLLLEHVESWTQWIPLVLLAAGLIASLTVALSPGPLAVGFFKLNMASFVVAGIVGLYLHYAGNVEFAVERDSSLAGFRLFWKAIRGATPALAPAALAQVGLLGLIYAYRDGAEKRGEDRKD